MDNMIYINGRFIKDWTNARVITSYGVCNEGMSHTQNRESDLFYSRKEFLAFYEQSSSSDKRFIDLADIKVITDSTRDLIEKNINGELKYRTYDSVDEAIAYIFD
jgi:hypothetical protein